MHAAHSIAKHLKFIDDEQAWTFSSKEPAALGFESGDDDSCIQVEGDIAGGDSDIPTSAAPFRQLVVSYSASRNREDGLLLQVGVEQFEDVSFTRAGGRLDHD